MSVALDGIRFSGSDFSADRKQILGCVLACFGINTGMTLLIGLAFIDDSSLWTGWVMLASMPCAVSVVVSSLVMKGDTKMSVLALTVIYVIALVLTPVLTWAVLGSAVDPLEILKYIALFIVIPFALSHLVRRLKLKSEAKSVFINVMMMLMVLIGLGSRRDYIFDNLDIVLWLSVACIVRAFVVGFVMIWAMGRAGVRREDGVEYLVMGVWKNSGMSISMTMALFGAVMPEAVLPCIVSLVIESVWFAVMTKVMERAWPLEPAAATEAACRRLPMGDSSGEPSGLNARIRTCASCGTRSRETSRS